MREQPFPCAVCSTVGADTRVDVVIHLDVPDAVIRYEPIDDPIRVAPHLRIAKVQLIPALVDHAPPLDLEEPVVRQLVRERTVNPHHLQLQPEAGNHSLFTNDVQQRRQALRKTPPGRQPLADVVPPGAVVVPTAVDAVIPAARFRCRLDQRQLLFGGRVAGKAVHVVVEDDGRMGVIRIDTPNPPPVLGKLTNGSLEPIRRERHGARHGEKPLARANPL